MIASVAALFAACDKSEDCGQAVGDENQISISALMTKVVPGTKTTDDGTNAAWVANDAIGLFCAQSNPVATNTQYTYSGSVWSTAAPDYWSDYTTLHQFYAYAPYAGANTLVGSIAIPVLNSQTGTISATQNVLFSNNQDAGVSKGGSGGNVPLIFKHALALIQLNFIIDSSVPANTKLSVATITGQIADAITTTKAGATLNLVTGAITSGGATANTITVQPALPVTLSATPAMLNVLLLPSTFSPNLTVQCTFPDSSTGTTMVSMGTNVVYAQSTRYTYTVTVSRSAITITGMTITPWTSGGAPVSINPIL